MTIEMSFATYNEAKQHLLYVCNLLSPTSKEQRAFVNFVHEMEADHLCYGDVLKSLVAGLYDGLQYGNWPESDTKASA